MKRVVFLFVAALAAGCGRKGPPLPPLIKLPVPPADFTAVRRGEAVALQFTVPAANTDNTRPANITRVDIYALTGGTAAMSEADLLKNGAKVTSIPVKGPRDPNQTIDVDVPPEEAEEVEPPEGRGLDQGAVAHAEDRLTDAARVAPAIARSHEAPRRVTADEGRPLLGPSTLDVPSRLYFGVGVSQNGRRGPTSKRVLVPLIDPPRSPSMLATSFDEHAVTLSWAAPAADTRAGTENELPSRPIGVSAPTFGYNVYEVASPAPTAVTPSPGLAASRLLGTTPLTKTPIGETRFADSRMTWGATRCYAVTAVETVGTLAVESDEPETTCVTLRDTFPPATPKGLTAVAGEGAISLIWDPNDEPDLDGYIVLRRTATDGPWTRITPQLIRETTFRDGVPSGAHYAYEVQAVDRAGNASAESSPAEDTAR